MDDELDYGPAGRSESAKEHFQAQCWICPFCYDDHGLKSDCKQEDLKEEITKLRRAVSAAYADVE